MHYDNVLMFEECICKKRKSVPNPSGLEENKEMLRFIVREVLHLSAEEYTSLWGTAFNNTYKISKYIAQVEKHAEKEAVFGKNSKNYILSLIFPETVKTGSLDDIFRLLDKNDSGAIKRLSKVGNREQADDVIMAYLNRFLQKVACFETNAEVYDFLSKAELLDMPKKVEAFSIIYRDYFCMLDFYFFNLPKERREREFRYYIKHRVEIPEGLEAVRFALQRKRKH